jgi:hypothetical protein
MHFLHFFTAQQPSRTHHLSFIFALLPHVAIFQETDLGRDSLSRIQLLAMSAPQLPTPPSPSDSCLHAVDMLIYFF